MEKLVDEMNNSLLYWLTARWRDDPPQLAMDESWMSQLQRTMRGLRRRWKSRFDDAAPELATHFTRRAEKRSTGRMIQIFADAGMTVDFKVSPLVRTVMGATVAENVSLIKSIPEEHLTDVEGIVMRSVTTGRDLGQLSKDLMERFEVPKKRAAFIARDQNSKMTSTITRVRQQEAGITTAIWVHSHGGKVPRPEHLAFSQGRLNGPQYEVAKGAFLEGVWTWPGTEVNCLLGDAVVDLSNGCHTVWRFAYEGYIVSVKAGSAVFRSTPNHPFLTQRGWVAADLIQNGDYVWKAARKVADVSVDDCDKAKFRIEDVFSALAVTDSSMPSAFGAPFNFHGDIPKSEVETVWAKTELRDYGQTPIGSCLKEFNLPFADVISRYVGVVPPKIIHPGRPSPLGDFVKRRRSQSAESVDVGFAAISHFDARFNKFVSNKSPRAPDFASDLLDCESLQKKVSDVAGLPIGSIPVVNRTKPHLFHGSHQGASAASDGFGDSVDSFAALFSANKSVDIPDDCSGLSPLGRQNEAISSERLAEIAAVNFENGNRIFEAAGFIYEALCVSEKISSEFVSGSHVYTLQSNSGWFPAFEDGIVTKNCRCFSRPVLEGF